MTAPRRVTKLSASNVPALQLVVVSALTGWLVVVEPDILNRRSITSLGIIASLLALAAMGQTLVVILGGLDLATPGYVMFGAYTASILAGREGVPLGLSFLIAAIVTGSIGAATGYFCHRYRVQPLVLSLGTGAALTGATLYLADGDYTSSPPDRLRSLASIQGKTFGIAVPPVVVLVLLAALALWAFLSHTAAGRRLYATGINVQAAGYTQVRTSVVWTLVFAASGALAAIAGMFIAGFGAGWSQSTGEPYLFSGIAAVLVGGTTFGSVRGSFTRTILGAVTLTILSTIIITHDLRDSHGRIVYGLVIIGVVTLYGRERHVRDRF